MTIAYRAAELDASELEESLLAPPSATPLSGDITVRSRREFESEDGRIASGTWETETGQSRWEFLTKGEIIHVLSGKMTVQRDGGEEVLLTPGRHRVLPDWLDRYLDRARAAAESICRLHGLTSIMQFTG